MRADMAERFVACGGERGPKTGFRRHAEDQHSVVFDHYHQAVIALIVVSLEMGRANGPSEPNVIKANEAELLIIQLRKGAEDRWFFA